MNVNLDLSSFSGAAGEVGTSTMLVLFVHSSLIPRLFLSHALKKIGEPGMRVDPGSLITVLWARFSRPYHL